MNSPIPDIPVRIVTLARDTFSDIPVRIVTLARDTFSSACLSFRITIHVHLVGHLHVVTSSLVNIRVSINITIISTIEPINLLLIDILQQIINNNIQEIGILL